MYVTMLMKNINNNVTITIKTIIVKMRPRYRTIKRTRTNNAFTVRKITFG